MTSNKRSNLRYYANGLLKLSIALTSLLFIYYKLTNHPHLLELSRWVDEMSSAQSIWLLLVFVMMIVNWTLESVKWKWMISKLENISMWVSLKAVFAGLTISFFTPNRIGEYAGRIFLLREADRIKATLITIFENFSQLVITLVVGSVGLIFYMESYTELHSYITWGIAVLMILFSVSIILLYVEIPNIDEWLLRIKWLHGVHKYINVITHYKRGELFGILMIALCRYVVFTFQFILLLHVFGVRASITDYLILISLVFLVMTLVPTFALTEIGVRGAVATFFLSRISGDPLPVLLATLSLWLVNLVIPSLLGIVFIFQFRFFRNKSNVDAPA